MHSPFHGDALDLLQGGCVDDIHRARRHRNGDIDSPSILTDRDVVGVAAERYALGDLQGLLVHYIKCAFRLITEVVTASVGGDCGAMANLNAVDYSYHFVRRRIDDVDIVPGAVRLDDANRARRQGQSE